MNLRGRLDAGLFSCLPFYGLPAFGTEPSFAEKFQHAEFAEDRRGR